MFDRLLDILLLIWHDFKPLVFVKEYEQGIKLRGGHWIKNLETGIHFKIPFYDEVLIHFSKDDTILLPSQKLTTKDGKTVTARGMILYYIEDIRLFLAEVNNAQQVISDLAMGVIAHNIVNGNYEDCYNDKIMNEISKEVRRKAKRCGVYVEYVKLTDISSSKTLNIFKESEAHL